MSITKRVALTFDDGPNLPYTNQILDILKKENIKAAFFVCGANIKRHPEIIRKIAKENHLIGNHSFSHNRLTTFLGINYGEILKTQKLIEDLTAQRIKLYRPPHGFMNLFLRKKLITQGFKIVLFDTVGRDWESKITSGKIVTNIVDNVKLGSIILLHDGSDINIGVNRSKTVQALPEIINKLEENNFQIVPLEELS